MSDGDVIPIDSAWIAAHPLPVHGSGTTKNSRGRVLAIGGSRGVPGVLRLTGEAALRAGAGKLQLATVESAAVLLGMLMPEAASIALPEDEDGEIGGETGELLEKSLEGCDALVVGPGVRTAAAATRLLRTVTDTPREEMTLLVDAMAIGCARDLRDRMERFRGRLIFTPHFGEMAVLTGRDEEEIAADPVDCTRAAAAEWGAVTVLKGSETVIAAPDGTVLHYRGGGTGLATGGSGDVLAGAIAGLAARGASPLAAAGWGVWLHGRAGRRVASMVGPIGFLARELPPQFPGLLPQ